MATPLEDQAQHIVEVRARMDASGRLVLPKEMRTALGIEEGDVLIFTRDSRQRGCAGRNAEAACTPHTGESAEVHSGGTIFVDELITERREEFRREMAE